MLVVLANTAICYIYWYLPSASGRRAVVSAVFGVSGFDPDALVAVVTLVATRSFDPDIFVRKRENDTTTIVNVYPATCGLLQCHVGHRAVGQI